jgi:hypothetical protein
MSPASYLAAPPRVAVAIVALSLRSAIVDWAIYGALVLSVLAVAAAVAFLVVRLLQGWRSFKRLRRHLGRELERLAESAEATADKAAAATDQPRLERSLARLRVALAQLAVIRSAVDEASDAFGRITAVYPRK